MVRVGRIVAAQGLGGEVRVALDTDFPERFVPGLAVVLRGAKGEEATRVRSSRPHRTGAVLAVEGLATRDAALSWVGAEVLVARRDRWPLPPGRMYVDDVVGLRVVDRDGTEIGRVTRVVPSPAHDLFEVDGGRLLIPAHHAWVGIDFNGGTLTLLRSPEVTDDAD